MNQNNESPPPTAYSAKLSIDLGRHPTTSLSDDHWEIISTQHYYCWHEASKIFQEINYESKGLIINSNWNLIIKNIHEYMKAMEKIENAKNRKESYEKILGEFPSENIIIDFHFRYNHGVSNLSIVNSSQSILSYTLFNIFLMMNISHPASINFYGVKVGEYETLQLSNHYFDNAILNSLDNKWPKVTFVDLKKTIKWFQHCTGEFNLIPKSRMEKAIFAIAHICTSETSPVNIIWIFYALETIFDTKVGENFRSLIYRIELLLNPTDRESKYLKKNLRALYDMRSAFVHGGLEVIHPLNNETLDRRVDDKFGEFMDATEFGFQLVLSCIQNIILNGWSDLTFEESITGKFI